MIIKMFRLLFPRKKQIVEFSLHSELEHPLSLKQNIPYAQLLDNFKKSQQN